MGVISILSPFKWLRWTLLALVLVSGYHVYQWAGPPPEATDNDVEATPDNDDRAAPVEPEEAAEEAAGGEAMAGGDWFWRVGLWLAAVAAAPWLLRPLVLSALERESNAVTGLTLTAFALGAWLLAMALGGFDFSGWLVPVMAIGGFLVAAAYFYAIFTRFEEARR